MIALLVAITTSHAGALGSDLLSLSGDTKSFFIVSLPYESRFMPETASGQGAADLRLKLDVRPIDGLRFQAHQTLTASTPAAQTSLLGGTGVGSTAEEAIDLTIELTEDAEEAGTLSVRTRTDRLWVGASVPHVDLRVGRQAISLGKGAMFTPMDLVGAFSPATVDTEYKAGVDAARIDAYAGMASQLTAVAAYAGSWDDDGLIFVGYGQTTLGLWDVGVLAGRVRGDTVGGLTTAGGLGPVAVQAEVTLTLPAERLDEDPFVRASLGGMWRATQRLTLSAEAYHQGSGADDPADYLGVYTDERHTRGELWAVGRWYAGLSAAAEITPLVYGSLMAIGNLGDGSALVGPGLSWSVSDSSEVVGSAFAGLGERPEGFALKSEFGLVPTMVFVEWKAYF